MSLFLWKALSIFNAINTTGSTPAYPAWHTPGCGLQADLALQFKIRDKFSFTVEFSSVILIFKSCH